MSEGIQFFISDSAKRRIATMLSDFKLKFEKEAIPAIMWIDSGLNSGTIDSQPAIGLYDHRDEIAPSDILVIDGIEIAIAVAEEDIGRFQKKTLYYENCHFLLR